MKSTGNPISTPANITGIIMPYNWDKNGRITEIAIYTGTEEVYGDEGNVKIDICVNESCGAVHLDPGELKSILKDQNALSAAKKAFLSVFKN